MWYTYFVTTHFQDVFHVGMEQLAINAKMDISITFTVRHLNF